MNRRQRSYVAQLRCGILPIAIETGRWIGKKPEERLCNICKEQEVEHEIHFLFMCSSYEKERQDFYKDMNDRIPDFHMLVPIEKIQIVMKEEHIILFSKYLCTIFDKRQSILFK